MKRLTKRCNGVVTYVGASNKYETGQIACEVDPQGVRELLDCVAAYEDTGLTPEECAEYKKFEDEAISKNVPFSRIVELMNTDAVKNEGLRFNLAASHGSGGHPDPVGPKGQMAECPVCGGMCDWTPETDISTCRVCGCTNGTAQKSVDRLRELAEADAAGRVAILPCEVGGAMLNVSVPERPQEMKDVHFSVSYVSSGIVFSQPMNIFLENIAAGYIKSLEETPDE